MSLSSELEHNTKYNETTQHCKRTEQEGYKHTIQDIKRIFRNVEQVVVRIDVVCKTSLDLQPIGFEIRSEELISLFVFHQHPSNETVDEETFFAPMEVRVFNDRVVFFSDSTVFGICDDSCEEVVCVFIDDVSIDATLFQISYQLEDTTYHTGCVDIVNYSSVLFDDDGIV